MNGILLAVISVTVIGLICGVMLAIVSKLMAVKEDERISRIRECLPGANCGACGYAGCDGYAAALVNDGAKTNLCVPGSDGVSLKISEILGVEYEDVIEQVAVVHCKGDPTVAKMRYEYHGIDSCAAAKLLYGGNKLCPYGCLGYGDCAKVCPKDAICVDSGVARIDTSVCIGCGQCVKACPNHLITTENDTIKTLVTCASRDRGADVRKQCSHGCIACTKCVRECPENAISIVDNLAVIDYGKCTGCGHCAEVCTTGCIQIASFVGLFNR